ncbi:MAG: pur operon repressor [Eubacteriales bacterium]|nr:pur operon repressor [Eubacteriales bacterium]
MKRTERVGAIIKFLTDSPGKLYPLQYFCDCFGAAKSSISEDISAANSAVSITGTGYIETIPGAKGGVRYIPDISPGNLITLQENLCDRIKDGSRILGGGFLYTSDIMFDTCLVRSLSTVFVKKFKNSGADYVATVETKGIPLASMVANQMNLPLVIIRREAKVSEGSTVSINYFSGSYDRVQKMSISKRAVVPGSKAIVIDDFMRGGGSIKGIQEILGEFDVSVVGIGLAIASVLPEKKKINEYTAIVYMGDVDEEKKTIDVFPNRNIF